MWSHYSAPKRWYTNDLYIFAHIIWVRGIKFYEAFYPSIGLNLVRLRTGHSTEFNKHSTHEKSNEDRCWQKQTSASQQAHKVFRPPFMCSPKNLYRIRSALQLYTIQLKVCHAYIGRSLWMTYAASGHFTWMHLLTLQL